MSESETSTSIEMKDITSTSFGYVIAFLLPGLVTLHGMRYWSETVKNVVGPTTAVTATIGPSIILLLAALALGLVISAVRCLVLERWICRKNGFATNFFRKLAEGEKLVLFKAVVDEHYRYHQFYGGIAIALVPGFSGWMWIHRADRNCWMTTLFVFAFLLLEFVIVDSAIDALKKYRDRGNDLIASPAAKEK